MTGNLVFANQSRIISHVFSKGNVDLVIVPGTKSTRADLTFLREQKWDVDLQAHVNRGGHVLGICGGYQMLGQVISDPDGEEGPPGEAPGLGLLQTRTVMQATKRLTRVAARHVASGVEFEGYEIHIGQTTGGDCSSPFASVNGQAEGAVSADGHVCGSYLHGMFANDNFRAAYLARLGHHGPTASYAQTTQDTLDALARHLEAHLDVDGILAAAR